MSRATLSLIGESRLLGGLARVARRSRADQTLIACQRGAQTTLRFGQQRIHQNFHSEAVDVWVKVACDGHVGVATTDAITPEALQRAVETAIAIARAGKRRRGAAFGTKPAANGRPRLRTFVDATVTAPIADVIRQIHREWTRAARLGYDLAGSFHAGHDEMAVVGSEGLARYQPFTTAGMKLIALQDGASGYAAGGTRDLRTLDIAALAERAVGLAQASRAPRDLPLGRYPCLLEPEAVTEVLEWLGYIGFGAKSLAERTSFLTGRLGDRLMGETISIADDARHPEGLATPFDYEGVLTQRVPLIERGVAAGVVYDTTYGALYHRPSTGHALPYDETEGPLPGHLTMAAGTVPRAQLERLMGDGLVITRFHYVNGLLDTRRALMTGLTRDGTFLVKRGQVVGAVKNLRFTQSILEAFSHVVALSRERRLVADPASGLGSCLAPAILLKGFTFTGKTQ